MSSISKEFGPAEIVEQRGYHRKGVSGFFDRLANIFVSKRDGRSFEEATEDVYSLVNGFSVEAPGIVDYRRHTPIDVYLDHNVRGDKPLEAVQVNDVLRRLEGCVNQARLLELKSDIAFELAQVGNDKDVLFRNLLAYSNEQLNKEGDSQYSVEDFKHAWSVAEKIYKGEDSKKPNELEQHVVDLYWMLRLAEIDPESIKNGEIKTTDGKELSAVFANWPDILSGNDPLTFAQFLSCATEVALSKKQIEIAQTFIDQSNIGWEVDGNTRGLVVYHAPATGSEYRFDVQGFREIISNAESLGIIDEHSLLRVDRRAQLLQAAEDHDVCQGNKVEFDALQRFKKLLSREFKPSEIARKCLGDKRFVELINMPEWYVGITYTGRPEALKNDQLMTRVYEAAHEVGYSDVEIEEAYYFLKLSESYQILGWAFEKVRDMGSYYSILEPISGMMVPQEVLDEDLESSGFLAGRLRKKIENSIAFTVGHKSWIGRIGRDIEGFEPGEKNKIKVGIYANEAERASEYRVDTRQAKIYPEWTDVCFWLAYEQAQAGSEGKKIGWSEDPTEQFRKMLKSRDVRLTVGLSRALRDPDTGPQLMSLLTNKDYGLIVYDQASKTYRAIRRDEVDFLLKENTAKAEEIFQAFENALKNRDRVHNALATCMHGSINLPEAREYDGAFMQAKTYREQWQWFTYFANALGKKSALGEFGDEVPLFDVKDAEDMNLVLKFLTSGPRLEKLKMAGVIGVDMGAKSGAEQRNYLRKLIKDLVHNPALMGRANFERFKNQGSLTAEQLEERSDLDPALKLQILLESDRELWEMHLDWEDEGLIRAMNKENRRHLTWATQLIYYRKYTKAAYNLILAWANGWRQTLDVGLDKLRGEIKQADPSTARQMGELLDPEQAEKDARDYFGSNSETARRNLRSLVLNHLAQYADGVRPAGAETFIDGVIMHLGDSPLLADLSIQERETFRNNYMLVVKEILDIDLTGSEHMVQDRLNKEAEFLVGLSILSLEREEPEREENVFELGQASWADLYNQFLDLDNAKRAVLKRKYKAAYRRMSQTEEGRDDWNTRLGEARRYLIYDWTDQAFGDNRVLGKDIYWEDLNNEIQTRVINFHIGYQALQQARELFPQGDRLAETMDGVLSEDRKKNGKDSVEEQLEAIAKHLESITEDLEKETGLHMGGSNNWMVRVFGGVIETSDRLAANLIMHKIALHDPDVTHSSIEKLLHSDRLFRIVHAPMEAVMANTNPGLFKRQRADRVARFTAGLHVALDIQEYTLMTRQEKNLTLRDILSAVFGRQVGFFGVLAKKGPGAEEFYQALEENPSMLGQMKDILKDPNVVILRPGEPGYYYYRDRLLDGLFKVASEVVEAGLFSVVDAKADIPWDDLRLAGIQGWMKHKIRRIWGADNFTNWTTQMQYSWFGFRAEASSQEKRELMWKADEHGRRENIPEILIDYARRHWEIEDLRVANMDERVIQGIAIWFENLVGDQPNGYINAFRALTWSVYGFDIDFYYDIGALNIEDVPLNFEEYYKRFVDLGGSKLKGKKVSVEALHQLPALYLPQREDHSQMEAKPYKQAITIKEVVAGIERAWMQCPYYSETVHLDIEKAYAVTHLRVFYVKKDGAEIRRAREDEYGHAPEYEEQLNLKRESMQVIRLWRQGQRGDPDNDHKATVDGREIQLTEIRYKEAQKLLAGTNEIADFYQHFIRVVRMENGHPVRVLAGNRAELSSEIHNEFELLLRGQNDNVFNEFWRSYLASMYGLLSKPSVAAGQVVTIHGKNNDMNSFPRWLVHVKGKRDEIDTILTEEGMSAMSRLRARALSNEARNALVEDSCEKYLRDNGFAWLLDSWQTRKVGLASSLAAVTIERYDNTLLNIDSYIKQPGLRIRVIGAGIKNVVSYAKSEWKRFRGSRKMGVKKAGREDFKQRFLYALADNLTLRQVSKEGNPLGKVMDNALKGINKGFKKVDEIAWGKLNIRWLVQESDYVESLEREVMSTSFWDRENRNDLKWSLFNHIVHKRFGFDTFIYSLLAIIPKIKNEKGQDRLIPRTMLRYVSPTATATALSSAYLFGKHLFSDRAVAGFQQIGEGLSGYIFKTIGNIPDFAFGELSEGSILGIVQKHGVDIVEILNSNVLSGLGEGGELVAKGLVGTMAEIWIFSLIITVGLKLGFMGLKRAQQARMERLATIEEYTAEEAEN